MTCIHEWYYGKCVHCGLMAVPHHAPTKIEQSQEIARLRLQNSRLVAIVKECITEPGATCWKSRAYAEQRIWYIDTIARAVLAEIGPEGKSCPRPDGFRHS